MNILKTSEMCELDGGWIVFQAVIKKKQDSVSELWEKDNLYKNQQRQ